MRSKIHSIAGDALALPAVPQPAADTQPWRDRMLITLFVLAIALPFVGTFKNYKVEITAFENRRAAPWPYVARNLKELRALPAEFEPAFSDRFGGRNTLIAFHHFVEAVVFEHSPVSNLMIGRSGWLYFLGEDGKSLDRDYRGIEPYPDLDPFAVAAEFKRRHDWLASRGIPYIVLIVPDKHTIYPEYLPFWVSHVAGGTRLDLLYAAMKSYPEVRMLDIRPALLEAKARERVYFKTDSHWNYLGAQVGYDALVTALKTVLPNVPRVPSHRPPYDPETDFYSGDLTKLMGLPEWFEEDDVAPFHKVLEESAARCAKPTTEPLPPDYPKISADVHIYVCDRPELPTALVYRDSMADLLIPMLSENFRRVVYVHDRRLDQALVERMKPDVVIDEMVERSMHAPLALPMS